MATKEYSCVKRTKKAFEMSLVELSKEIPFNKITVKQLCERADLSRNAFYFHYSDINALIEDIENSIIQEIEALLENLDEIGFPKNVYASVDGLVDIFDTGGRGDLLNTIPATSSIKLRLYAAFTLYLFAFADKL